MFILPNHIGRTTIWLILALALSWLPTSLRAQFDYITEGGTITITRYTGPGGAVTIPNTISGKSVTAIGDSAFYGCETLTSITFPSSLSRIDGWAFSYCLGLTNVTLPNSVTNLGDGAFNECANINSINIPSKVISIGSFAFFNCAMPSVILPSSAIAIGEGPFAACSHLTSISVDPNNPSYRSANGVLFEKNMQALVQYPLGRAGDYTIPETVTAIRRVAFYGPGLLTGLLTPANHPVFASVDGVLFNTSRTTLVVYPCGRVGDYGIPDGVTALGDYSFAGATYITNVAFPGGLRRIGEEAFGRCHNLDRVTLPFGLDYIGDWAFFSCNALSAVCFKGNAPQIGMSIFVASDQVFVFYLPGTAGWGSTFGDCPAFPWVLPNPVIIPPQQNDFVNAFGFRISWASNATVVVETSPNMTPQSWTPMMTNTLISGYSIFADRTWAPGGIRFYRVRSQF